MEPKKGQLKNTPFPPLKKVEPKKGQLKNPPFLRVGLAPPFLKVEKVEIIKLKTFFMIQLNQNKLTEVKI